MPAEKTRAEASEPSATRATGPIQPRFTASTKKKTMPSRVTTPPAQARTFALKRSAKVRPLHHGGWGGSAGGGRFGGTGGRGCAGGRDGEVGATGTGAGSGTVG